jgi:hypothetical protein
MPAARARGVSWRLDIIQWRELTTPQRDHLRRCLEEVGADVDADGHVRLFDRTLIDGCLQRLKLLRQPSRMTLLIHGFGELRSTGTPGSAA